MKHLFLFLISLFPCTASAYNFDDWFAEYKVEDIPSINTKAFDYNEGGPYSALDIPLNTIYKPKKHFQILIRGHVRPMTEGSTEIATVRIEMITILKNKRIFEDLTPLHTKSKVIPKEILTTAVINFLITGKYLILKNMPKGSGFLTLHNLYPQKKYKIPENEWSGNVDFVIEWGMKERYNSLRALKEKKLENLGCDIIMADLYNNSMACMEVYTKLNSYCKSLRKDCALSTYAIRFLVKGAEELGDKECCKELIKVYSQGKIITADSSKVQHYTQLYNNLINSEFGYPMPIPE